MCVIQCDCIRNNKIKCLFVCLRRCSRLSASFQLFYFLTRWKQIFWHFSVAAWRVTMSIYFLLIVSIRRKMAMSQNIQFIDVFPPHYIIWIMSKLVRFLLKQKTWKHKSEGILMIHLILRCFSYQFYRCHSHRPSQKQWTKRNT